MQQEQAVTKAQARAILREVRGDKAKHTTMLARLRAVPRRLT